MIAGRPHRDTGRKPVFIERSGSDPIVDDESTFTTPAGAGRVVRAPAAPRPVERADEQTPELPPMTVVRRPRF